MNRPLCPDCGEMLNIRRWWKLYSAKCWKCHHWHLGTVHVVKS